MYIYTYAYVYAFIKEDLKSLEHVHHSREEGKYFVKLHMPSWSPDALPKPRSGFWESPPSIPIDLRLILFALGNTLMNGH